MVCPPSLGFAARPLSLYGDWPTEGWWASTPTAEGLDPSDISGLAIYAGSNSTTSLIIVKNKKIVHEQYWGSETVFALHDVQSIAKSLIGLTVGIAVDNTLIDVTDTVQDWYPGQTGSWTSVTVQHLLDMASGVNMNNTTDYTAMQATSDWPAYVLGKSFDHTPGTWYRYKADPQILSGIINLATGVSAASYFNSHVLSKIGVTNYTWTGDSSGHSDGDGGFSTTARNLARIGLLMLSNGAWDGQQLISTEWIEETVSRSLEASLTFTDVWDADGQTLSTSPPMEHHNMWWARKFDGSTPQDAYYAFGGSGNFIVVVPSKDLVLVRTGTGPATPDETFLETMLDYIAAA